MSDDWYFGQRGRIMGAFLMCLLAISVYNTLGDLGLLQLNVPFHWRVRNEVYVGAILLGASIRPPVALMAVFSAMAYSFIAMLLVGVVEIAASYALTGGLVPEFIYARIAYIAAVITLTLLLLRQFSWKEAPPKSAGVTVRRSLVQRLDANSHLNLTATVCTILGFLIALAQLFAWVRQLLRH